MRLTLAPNVVPMLTTTHSKVLLVVASAALLALSIASAVPVFGESLLADRPLSVEQALAVKGSAQGQGKICVGANYTCPAYNGNFGCIASGA